MRGRRACKTRDKARHGRSVIVWPDLRQNDRMSHQGKATRASQRWLRGGDSMLQVTAKNTAVDGHSLPFLITDFVTTRGSWFTPPTTLVCASTTPPPSGVILMFAGFKSRWM